MSALECLALRKKLFRKMDFYYENYDFQGEKQVFCKSCKTALEAKMTTSI